MDTSKKPVQIEGTRAFKEGELTFLINPEIPSWCMLDDVGCKILQHCTGENTLEDIYKTVQSEISHDHFLTIIRYLRKSLIISFDSPHFTGIAVDTPPLPPLVNLSFEITARCNLRCIHCEVSAGQPRGKEVSLEKLKECIDYLAAINGWTVNIGGGEPLVRKGWDELLEYSLSKGLRASVETNGTLIDEKVADIFEQYDPKRLIVQISLDGPNSDIHDKIRGKGAFAKAMRGIEHLLDRGMEKNIRISFTANRYNIEYVQDIIDMCLERNIGELQLYSVYELGRAKQAWDVIGLTTEEAIQFQKFMFNARNQLKGKINITGRENVAPPAVGAKVPICSMGMEFNIDPLGNVFPCGFFYGTVGILGNINTESLASIRNGEKFYRLREKICQRVKTIPKCRACIWRNMCGAGCSALADYIYGDMNDIDPLCEFWKWWFRYLTVERVRELGLYHIPYS